MKEQAQPDTTQWRTEVIGPSAVVRVREIDPEIQAQMPTETRTFMDIGPFELAIRDLKKFLGRK